MAAQRCCCAKAFFAIVALTLSCASPSPTSDVTTDGGSGSGGRGGGGIFDPVDASRDGTGGARSEGGLDGVVVDGDGMLGDSGVIDGGSSDTDGFDDVADADAHGGAGGSTNDGSAGAGGAGGREGDAAGADGREGDAAGADGREGDAAGADGRESDTGESDRAERDTRAGDTVRDDGRNDVAIADAKEAGPGDGDAGLDVFRDAGGGETPDGGADGDGGDASTMMVLRGGIGAVGLAARPASIIVIHQGLVPGSTCNASICLKGGFLR